MNKSITLLWIIIGACCLQSSQCFGNENIKHVWTAKNDVFKFQVSSTIFVTACDTYTSPSGNFTWTTSGVYEDTIPASGGGDSIITINLTVAYEQTYAYNEIACVVPFISPSGKEWSTDGMYQDTIPTFLGCDSVLTVDLTFITPTIRNINMEGCDSVVGPGGRVVYDNKVFLDTINCDSVYRVFATVNKTSITPISVRACESYTSPSGLYTWSSDGLYMDTLTSIMHGCDSVLEIDLSLHTTENVNVELTACNFMISPSGKYTWQNSGNYVDTIMATTGCDSILHIDATIYPPVSEIVDSSFCGPIVSASGKYTYTESGIYYDTIQTTIGCDSVLIYNLEIGELDVTVVQEDDLLVAQAQPAEYQWLDCANNNTPINGGNFRAFAVEISGNYAVEITQFNCIDTSDCFLVEANSIMERQQKRFGVNYDGKNLMIDIKVPLDLTLKVFQINGVLVQQQTIKHSGKIALHKLTSGLYVIHVSSKDEFVTTKIIVP